jgi:hypothetical protein
MYRLHESALARCKIKFDFDLFGSARHSLAPNFS